MYRLITVTKKGVANLMKMTYEKPITEVYNYSAKSDVITTSTDYPIGGDNQNTKSVDNLFV